MIVGPWEKDFSKARNESFQAAEGEWLAWMDTDDVLASADSDAVRQSLSLSGIHIGVTPSGEDGDKDLTPIPLREALSSLPEEINCCLAPYHYAEDADGRCTHRLTRKRIVRWSAGWSWEGAVHEDLVPQGGYEPKVYFLPGFVVRHLPVFSPEIRHARNAEILKTVLVTNKKPAHTLLYQVAMDHLGSGKVPAALEFLQRAIDTDPPRDYIYVYRLLYVRLVSASGNQANAVYAAEKITRLFPDRREGWLESAVVAHRGSSEGEALRLLRMGFGKPNDPLGLVQNPVRYEGEIRWLGAHLLRRIGEVKEAEQWEAAALAWISKEKAQGALGIHQTFRVSQ